MAKVDANLDYENICFVLSPIGTKDSEIRKHADEVYKYIISPVTTEFQIKSLRSDHLNSPGLISQQVIRYIHNSKIIIADLTGYNPNVFYELAIAHAYRKPVITIISVGQELPFDITDVRTIPYELTVPGVEEAKQSLRNNIAAVLDDTFDVQSPVTLAAQLEELSKTGTSANTKIAEEIFTQISSLSISVNEIRQLIIPKDEIKKSIPGYIQDNINAVVEQYSNEIDILQSVRQAGIIGVHKRRESAIQAFAKYIDEESREIMIIGSSLKGLLQKDEYAEFSKKLKFKYERGIVRIKFLLTHPILADLRASQEQRRPTEIGLEIIKSLEVLKSWEIPASSVRLYLGTPTCFAIKTSRQMLVNPYPYASTSFDSPCLILENHPEGSPSRLGYFFDEFNSSHFGAWDTDMSVQFADYDDVINLYRGSLHHYAESINDLLIEGKNSQH
jgi:hypothetical protein